MHLLVDVESIRKVGVEQDGVVVWWFLRQCQYSLQNILANQKFQTFSEEIIHIVVFEMHQLTQCFFQHSLDSAIVHRHRLLPHIVLPYYEMFGVVGIVEWDEVTLEQSLSK